MNIENLKELFTISQRPSAVDGLQRLADDLGIELIDDEFPDEQEISERLFLDASGYDNQANDL